MRGLTKESHGESHEAVYDLRVTAPSSPVGRYQATTLRTPVRDMGDDERIQRQLSIRWVIVIRLNRITIPARPPDLPCRRSGFRRERIGSSRSRHLNDSVESAVMNVRGPCRIAKANSPPITGQGVGAAIVVRGRESRPQGEGRQSVGSTDAKVTEW